MLLNLLKRIVRSAASSNAASSLSKHPSPEEPLRIARDALAAGDSARAIRLLNDVLAHDPAQRDALVLLGETRQAAGDAAAAETAPMPNFLGDGESAMMDEDIPAAASAPETPPAVPTAPAQPPVETAGPRPPASTEQIRLFD